MRSVSAQKLKRLPQSDEVWQLLTYLMRIWITPPDEQPSRPYLIMVFDVTNDLIVASDLAPTEPSPDKVRDVLFKAMSKPPRGAGPARRPRSLGIADRVLLEALAPALTELGITPIEQTPPDEMQELILNMEEHLRGGEEHPGLLSVAGVTPELVGGVFEAAAEFYRAAPWVLLLNEQVIAVRFPAEAACRYVSVMGNAGIEYGLAPYLTWEDVERAVSPHDEDPLHTVPETGLRSFFFDRVTLVPFDDLEAIRRYGWEVVNDQAYPIPIYINKQTMQAERPDVDELKWYEVTLRAIPIFVRDYLQPDGRGDYQPVEATLEVPTQAGPAKVDLKYPAGALNYTDRPAQDIEWENFDINEDEAEEMPFFDRRAMEGMMRKAVAEKFGEQPTTGDPQLDRAQQIMDRAWSETNPGRRLTLAHEALSVSPDCADAYVLLAEEEADTVGRALEYYQKGVKAGQRALGDAYFTAHVGDFWGLLETRPYMRALEGQARTLWRMRRSAEAALLYFEMLRLNPGDNQGVRYSLVDLLLDLDRDDDVIELLKQYKGDWTAVWQYTRALLKFRRYGASDKAVRALREALSQNPHVPPYLTGHQRIPNRLPEYMGLGDEREAVHYAAAHLNHWRRTPGAVEWLKERVGAQPPGPKPAARTKPAKSPSRRKRGRG